jgi:hypothetical protein
VDTAVSERFAADTSSGATDRLYSYYTNAFASFHSLNDTFKVSHMCLACGAPHWQLRTSGVKGTTSASGIDDDLMHACFDCLCRLPSKLHNCVMKTIINCLLSEHR